MPGLALFFRDAVQPCRVPSVNASFSCCEQGCGRGSLLQHVTCAAFSVLHRASVMLQLQHMYRKANVLWQAPMFLLCKVFRLSLCCDGCACKLVNNFQHCLPCRNACILVLSNGFSVGCIISVLLHLALPFDAVDNVDADSASAVSTHVNPTAEGDITHQKVCATKYSRTYCCPYASGLMSPAQQPVCAILCLTSVQAHSRVCLHAHSMARAAFGLQ